LINADEVPFAKVTRSWRWFCASAAAGVVITDITTAMAATSRVLIVILLLSGIGLRNCKAGYITIFDVATLNALKQIYSTNFLFQYANASIIYHADNGPRYPVLSLSRGSAFRNGNIM
jgi:hypothetical protein